MASTPILTQILSLINLGQSILQAVETVVPGADPAFWQMVVNRHLTNPNPKKAKKQTKRSATRKASKKSNYAKMQSALAWSTAELVERVNGGEPRFVNGQLEVF